MGTLHYSVVEICHALRGTIRQRGEATIITGVSTDSRKLQHGDLFIALRGERFDGHDFVQQAAAAGAPCVAVDKEGALPPPSVSVIVVEDTLAALGRLAAYHRQRFDIPVIAVTGSVGKTITKELIATSLAPKYCVLKAQENFNNEVGVPLTLLELDSSHGAVVLEFAMRGAGQIRYLTEIATPTIGAITNIGLSHVGLLGSRDAIACAKGELLAAMSPDGLAVLNADDAYCDFLKGMCRCRVATFGWHKHAEYMAEDVRLEWRTSATGEVEVFTHFVARDAEGTGQMTLPLGGKHYVSNALVATAVARHLGLSFGAIQEGFTHVEVPHMRQQWLLAPRGFILLDDAYNSSPDSLRAALEVIRDAPTQGKRVAILGDIKELGTQASAIHRELGGELLQYGVTHLICLGEFARDFAEGARAAGLSPECIYTCDSHDDVAAVALRLLTREDVALVKASRAVRMEEVVARLMLKGERDVNN